MTLIQILNVESTPLRWMAPNPSTERIEYIDIRIDYYPGWMSSTPPQGSELYYFRSGVFVNFGYGDSNQFKVYPQRQICHYYWNRVEALPDSNFCNLWFNVGLKVSAWVSYS
jgi:hypothetical protein